MGATLTGRQSATLCDAQLPAAINIEPLCGRVHLNTELRKHAFAHSKLLDLAGNRHGELIDEAYVLRNFVVSNALAAELAHDLAVARIGQSENLHVVNFRIREPRTPLRGSRGR
jgi:hypothetical protein